MHTLQLHYTSCLRGLASGAGLQTRAMTPGISEGERHDLESRMTYARPMNSPDRPTEDELFEFPRAFRYAQLGPDRWLLLRIAYSGQDYTQRSGNIFGHALLTGGGAPTRSPMDLYEWDGWVGALPPEEDTLEDPPPLSPIDIDSIPSAISFTYEELSAFLKGSSGYARLLPRMIAAVFAARAQSRPLVVCADPGDGTYWVACLHKAFPLEVAIGLSFSTYQFHERGCADINATTAETDIRFDEQNRRFRFYMFDPAGQSSEVAADWDGYAKIVGGWLAGAPESMVAFQEFSSMFVGLTLDADLLAQLARLSIADRVAQDDVEPLAAFAEAKVRPGAEAGVAAHLDRAVALLAKANRWTAALQMLRAQGAVAVRGGGGALDQFFTRWFATYAATVMDSAARRQTGEMRRTLHERLGAARNRLYSDLIEHTWLTRLLEQLELSPGPGAEAVLGDVIEAARAVGRPPRQIEPVLGLLRVARDASPDAPTCRRLLELFAVEDAPFVAATLADGPCPDKVGEAVARRFPTFDGALPTLRELDRCGLAPAVEGVLRHSMRMASDPVEVWKRIAVELPRLRTTPRAWLGPMLADLPPTKAQCVALAMVGSNGPETALTREVVERIANLANTALALPEHGLSPGNTEVTKLAELAGSIGLVLQPDWPLLRTLIAEAKSVEGVRRGDFDGLPASLQGVDPDGYRSFLEGFLVTALGRASSPDEHRRLLAATWNGKQSTAFWAGYEPYVRSMSKGVWTRSRAAGLGFWLTLAGDDKGLVDFLERRDRVLSLWVDALAGSADLDNTLNQCDKAGWRGWSELSTRIESKRPSRITRLFRGNR